MTRYALLSHVHGDVGALVDALRQIDAMGIRDILCTGDLVDYGPEPEATLRLLRQREVVSIRGNHDRWALGTRADDTGQILTASAAQYLSSLPPELDLEIEGVRVALRPGQPGSDMEGIDPLIRPSGMLDAMLTGANHADVLVVGHTHRPFLARAPGGGLVVSPGALLRDAKPGVFVATPGVFGVLELPSRAFRVHAAYDGAPVPFVGEVVD